MALAAMLMSGSTGRRRIMFASGSPTKRQVEKRPRRMKRSATADMRVHCLIYVDRMLSLCL
eukprot:1472488-Amphidinium_carterae.1